MKKLLRFFIFEILLALISLSPLRAPADSYELLPPKSSASSTNTSPAPEAAIKNLSELVHAGKFDDAQQSLTALLMLFPKDQRLIKAQAVLDKASGRPDSESFTGTDKTDYDTLIELAKEAQQNLDPDQQNALLKQFMTQSSPFLKKHPDELLLWKIRAAGALSLGDPNAGYDAGQKLLAANSNDPNVQQLLAQLKLKGWLDKQAIEAQQAAEQKQQDLANKFGWIVGTWNVTTTWKFALLVPTSTSTRGEKFVLSGSIIEGYQINDSATIQNMENMRNGAGATGLMEVMRGTRPDMRGTILDSGEITWAFASNDGWSPVISCETDTIQGTMKMLFDPTGKGSAKHPMTLMFTKGYTQPSLQQKVSKALF